MTRIRLASALVLATMMAMSGLLSACGEGKAIYPDKEKGDTAPRMSNEKQDSIFGSEGLFGLNGDKKDKNGANGGAVGIGVNSFLWRASLDTISFMPIATADPFGGTILTDWYQMPESPNERYKLNIFIVDRALRSDGIKVSVFKQVQGGNGQWADTAVDPKMASDIENSILTRARQLRIVSE